MNGYGRKEHHQTDDGGADECVAEHLTGLGEVVGTYEVGGLDRKSERRGVGDAAQQPRGALHKTNGSRSLSAYMTHHRSVDEEHEHRRHLCENRRNTQSYNKTEFLACTHRPPFAYAGEKLVTVSQ